MSDQVDKSFLWHELSKSLKKSITDCSELSSKQKEEIIEDFQEDIEKNPILSISRNSGFSLYTFASARSLIIFRNDEDSIQLARVIRQWWKDPSIRKLVNTGSIPSYAINAAHASSVMMGIAEYIDRLWLRYFGSHNKTRMPLRSSSSLSFANLMLLRYADEKLDNNGHPYETLFDMNVCKKCGYPEEGSPHHHEEDTVVCAYPICDKKKGHLIRVCGFLQGLCYECGRVGHLARSHRDFRPDVLKTVYAEHRTKGILYSLGLEIFVRRKQFHSKDDFEPMEMDKARKPEARSRPSSYTATMDMSEGTCSSSISDFSSLSTGDDLETNGWEKSLLDEEILSNFCWNIGDNSISSENESSKQNIWSFRSGLPSFFDSCPSSKEYELNIGV